MSNVRKSYFKYSVIIGNDKKLNSLILLNINYANLMISSPICQILIEY